MFGICIDVYLKIRSVVDTASPASPPPCGVWWGHAVLVGLLWSAVWFRTSRPEGPGAGLSH